MKEEKTDIQPNHISTKRKASRRSKKLPVLRGRVVGAMLYVYCPWCDREHVHSYDPDDKFRPTHRAAHCHNLNNPAVARGYYVAPFRKKDVSHHASTTVPELKKQSELASMIRRNRSRTAL